MKDTVCISIDRDLLGWLDSVRGAVPRSPFVELLLQQARDQSMEG